MKVIVCDAGPIIHLAEANCLELLKNTGEILLPKSVSFEIQSVIDISESWPEWLKVITLSSSEEKEAEAWVHYKFNFSQAYLDYDTARQLELESYGYRFLRINKFNL